MEYSTQLASSSSILLIEHFRQKNNVQGRTIEYFSAFVFFSYSATWFRFLINYLLEKKTDDEEMKMHLLEEYLLMSNIQ